MKVWTSYALVVCLVGAPGVLTIGCGSDDDGGNASGDAGADGGASGTDGGASGSSSGGRSGSGGRPAIPPATYEGCSALAPTYDGSDCTSACASVRCDCDPFPASYLGCHQERGCLTAVDCGVACERDLGDVVSCIGDYAPCDDDSDCAEGRCVGSDDGPSAPRCR
jgi:hypothetical protein